jgi:hypothetical protein
MTRARVQVQIDRLVLEGVRPADRARVQAAVTRELGRLLAAHGAPSAGGAATRRGAEVPTSASGADPAALGAQVAGAVYRQLPP